MWVQALWLVVPLGLVVAGVAAWRLASAWLRYRGERVITCPENRRPAGVRVDAGHAAASALHGSVELRLSACSRWPERAGCGQQCLAQIEASPEDCLVRNILEDWYRGKVCASCGRPFGEIHWAVQKPALICAGPYAPGAPAGSEKETVKPGGITADKINLEWNQVPAERLRETLAAAAPLCFACHMASTLVREHPELAIDRGPLEARRTSS